MDPNSSSNRESSRKFFGQFTSEIERIVPQWSFLRTQSRGWISYHVLRMLYCVLHDTRFNALSLREQNILKWAVLLHDISKRGIPLLPPNTKDSAHPYTSGIATLDVLSSLYNFKAHSPEIYSAINAIKEMLREALLPDDVTDLSRLGEILGRAASTFGPQSFSYLVFKLVIIHQAPPTLLDFKQPAELTADEMRNYLDIPFFQLLRILMVNDSINYHLHEPHLMIKYSAAFQKLLDHYAQLIQDPSIQLLTFQS